MRTFLGLWKRMNTDYLNRLNQEREPTSGRAQKLVKWKRQFVGLDTNLEVLFEIKWELVII